MFITDLKSTEDVNISPDGSSGEGKVILRWLLGESQGALNFEMRYFSLSGEIATEWHNHDWEHQVFIINGKGMLKCEDKEIELLPESAVFIEPGERHCFICTGDCLEFICIVPLGTCM